MTKNTEVVQLRKLLAESYAANVKLIEENVRLRAHITILFENKARALAYRMTSNTTAETHHA